MTLFGLSMVVCYVLVLLGLKNAAYIIAMSAGVLTLALQFLCLGLAILYSIHFVVGFILAK